MYIIIRMSASLNNPVLVDTEVFFATREGAIRFAVENHMCPYKVFNMEDQ